LLACELYGAFKYGALETILHKALIRASSEHGRRSDGSSDIVVVVGDDYVTSTAADGGEQPFTRGEERAGSALVAHEATRAATRRR
jgi:hypothetical protein